MGVGLSANYDQINFIFSTGPWKVHSAVHRTTNSKVSLWLFDQAQLDSLVPNKSDQDKYVQGYLNGIQKARKLRHPHILKVLEVQDKLASLAFSAEPVSSCLTSLIGSFNQVDSSYICYQLAETLLFLHKDAHMAHLNISPDSVFLDDSLSLKLFNFNWLTLILPENSFKLPFSPYNNLPGFPFLKYSAPELVTNKIGTPQSDVFSFALVFYEIFTSKSLLNPSSVSEYDVGRNPIFSVQGVDSVFYNLLSDCLQPQPAQRPHFSSILAHDIFESVQLKILRYLDMIIAKDPKDKFNFYKGLAKTIEQFSPLMIKTKIIPVLISECKSDIRFAPVLLGSIFKASESFTVSEFTSIVFKNIAFLSSVTDPPQVSIALIQNITQIIDKTEQSLHADSVYPILFSALQSNDAVLQRESLKKLPLIVEKINETAVRLNMLPKLADLANNSNETTIVASAISCIAICLSKSDPDLFLKEIFPKVCTAWKKNQNATVARSMFEVIDKCKASNRMLLFRAVPAAADVASNLVCEPFIQKKLCDWILNAVAHFKVSNRLDDAVEPSFNPTAPSSPPQNEEKAAPIDFDSFLPKETFSQPKDVFSQPKDVFSQPKDVFSQPKETISQQKDVFIPGFKESPVKPQQTGTFSQSNDSFLPAFPQPKEVFIPKYQEPPKKDPTAELIDPFGFPTSKPATNFQGNSLHQGYETKSFGLPPPPSGNLAARPARSGPQGMNFPSPPGRQNPPRQKDDLLDLF